MSDHPHAPLRCGGGLAQGSLRQDCALYFRDLAVATVIFLPVWSLLYLLRLLVSH
jgi:hypothetical protein